MALKKCDINRFLGRWTISSVMLIDPKEDCVTPDIVNGHDDAHDVTLGRFFLQELDRSTDLNVTSVLKSRERNQGKASLTY